MLWEVSPVGFAIHDYTDWNDSKRIVENRQMLARHRKAFMDDPGLRKALRMRDRDHCRYCGIVVNWSDRKGCTGATHATTSTQRDRPRLKTSLSLAEAATVGKKDRTPEAAGMVLINLDGVSRSDLGRVSGFDPVTKPNQTKPKEEAVEHTHSAREKFGPTLIGNEHRAHAACGRICVPAFLHRQFKDALGGAELDADTRLRGWYDRVFDQLPLDVPVPTDAAKFWRPLFDAEFVAAKPAVSISLEAHVEGMREILRKQGNL